LNFIPGTSWLKPGAAPQPLGILDFEGAIAADPLLDIAKAVFYFTARDEAKRAVLFAGYGAIDRRDVQPPLELCHLYCLRELWCWLAQIGDHQPLAKLTAQLERSPS
jgi:aminoglycoside phosphotransferase (APT) family kinase protein